MTPRPEQDARPANGDGDDQDRSLGRYFVRNAIGHAFRLLVLAVLGLIYLFILLDNWILRGIVAIAIIVLIVFIMRQLIKLGGPP